VPDEACLTFQIQRSVVMKRGGQDWKYALHQST
jgi:hypothetical protein